MARPFGIVIEVQDPVLANATLEVPYPDKQRPVYDAFNKVVGYEAKRFRLSFYEGRTEVSPQVWDVIQASMTRWSEYPRIEKVGETFTPATQQVGGATQPREVFQVNDAGVLVPLGTVHLPVTPYSRNGT